MFVVVVMPVIMMVVAVPGGGPFVEDGWAGRRLRAGSATDGLVIEVGPV